MLGFFVFLIQISSDGAKRQRPSRFSLTSHGDHYFQNDLFVIESISNVEEELNEYVNLVNTTKI
jgi:hypothetical protein